MLKNKIVRLAALLLGSFALINVGMFFFLKMTQPKIGPRVETTAKTENRFPADSTLHPNVAVKADTVTASSPIRNEPVAAESAVDSTVSQQPVASSLVPPGEPALPAPPPPEKSLSSVDSTPVANAPDSATSNTQIAAAALNGDSKELAKLAKLLESVKPEEAASIAAQLDVDQIVTLVMKMKDRSAGRMLAKMPPEQAARVALRMTQLSAQTRGRS